MGLVVCFLFLAFVEGILRISGLTRTDGEDPFVGFSGVRPLYEVKDGRAETSAAKLRYFNAVSFQAQKPPNTLRVFCFGGSTTYGHPFDGRTAFSRWLQDFLKASLPEKNVEVINAGGISYASYRIVPLIRETLAYSPDLMIVYTGHNEFLETRTYSGMLARSGALMTAQSALENLSLYQGLKRLLDPLTGRQVAESAKEGTRSSSRASGAESKYVLQEEVTAVLDRSAGLDLYHRNEEFSRGVVEHFAYNLQQMISLCKKAGVPIILVDPPSNLKDFSPFKSEHGQGLTASQKSQIKAQLLEAMRLHKEGRFGDCLASANAAAQKDPLFAEAHFWKGKALLSLKRHSEVKEAFVAAKDLDVCPLRCISPIEERIRSVAAATKTVLVPFKAVAEQRASDTGDKSGIPGNESFLDHVHPTIEMHQALGEMLLKTMDEHGLVRPTRKLSAEEIKSIGQAGVTSLDQEFFLTRDMNLAKTLRWAGKKDEARAALERAARGLERNPEVHKMLGSYLLEDSLFDKAIEEYRKAVEFSGDDPAMEFALATAYTRAGRRTDAMAVYRQLVKQEASIPEAYGNLAVMCLQEGNTAEATKILESGLRKYPDAPSLMGPYALALAVTGRIREAIPLMTRVTRLEPGDPNHFYNLAGMCALDGRTSDALKFLDLAVQKGYSNVEKLEQDEVFHSIRNHPEFGKTLDRIR
jgi:tetratricopeptide (TPR) repeat protein